MYYALSNVLCTLHVLQNIGSTKQSFGYYIYMIHAVETEKFVNVIPYNSKFSWHKNFVKYAKLLKLIIHFWGTLLLTVQPRENATSIKIFVEKVSVSIGSRKYYTTKIWSYTVYTSLSCPLVTEHEGCTCVHLAVVTVHCDGVLN